MREADSGGEGPRTFTCIRVRFEKIVIKKEDDLVYIEITADGFLYKMVRNMAGTLLAVGSGQLPKSEVPQILKAKNRKAAGDTAPAEGLCLIKVKY